MSTAFRTALRSPISSIVGGCRFWRSHGALVRRARVLCQYADGIRLRRLRACETRSDRLYRRSIGTLAQLVERENAEPESLARAAHRTLASAQTPYRGMAVGFAVLVCALAAAITLVLSVAVGVSPALRTRLFPPDLAAGRPWILHTGDSGPSESGTGPATDGSHFFHTGNVDNPSVEIDLGAEHLIRGVTVENRASCCKERALPLNVEIFDGNGWRLIAQRHAYFSTWSPNIAPVRAQRVRIRRPGTNFFHLKRISIYGQ
jgi:hypothetical protein